MSLKAMLWVMENSEEKLARRLVLIALADNAHDDGTNAFPSLETIARKAGITERHARSCLTALEEAGAISRETTGPISKRGDNWTILLGENPSPGSENPSPESEKSSPPYIEEPSIEPSTTSRVASPVSTLWETFVAMRQHSPKKMRATDLDPQTRRMIEKALTVGTEEEWDRAIRGILRSPHHIGKNDRQTVYLEPRHVFTACTHGTIRQHLDWLLDLTPQTASTSSADGFTSSAQAAKIVEHKRNVLRAHDLAGSAEAQRSGDESERWLAQHGIRVVRNTGPGGAPERPTFVHPEAGS